MRGAYPEGENLCLLLCRNRDVGDQRVCFVIEFFQLEVTKLEMRWIDTVTSINVPETCCATNVWVYQSVYKYL